MTEYFDVVDENSNVTGKATREECHKNGLWHRAVHIIVVNSKKEMLLQKRSIKKDLYKGYWIGAAAGHVDSGESFEETAKRELKEELGIEAQIKHIFDFRKFTGNDNEVIRVFLVKHDGPFSPNAEEVDFVKFFSIEEIFRMMRTESFTPATLDIMRRIEAEPEILNITS